MPRKGDGLYLRGKTWYLDFWHHGIRHQKRLGKHISRTVAVELARVERSDVLRGEAGIGKKKLKDVSFDQAAELFLSYVKGNRRLNTFKDYALCVGQLKKSFSGKQLSQISPITVERHKQMRKEQGAKVRANRELSCLKNLFNRARHELKLYEGSNPVEHVKLLHEDQRRLRFLEPDEEERLLAQAAEPLRSIILLGIHTGLRARAEMLTLRWDNVDLKRRVLTIIGAYAKNKESRQVNLNSKVVDALTRLKDRAASEYVFAKPDGMPYDSIRNAFASACQRAGLEDVTPHTLRHTFASRLVMAGVDLRTIQELGGWKQLRMIERYGHVNDRHKAEAVEKLVQSPTGVTTIQNQRLTITA